MSAEDDRIDARFDPAFQRGYSGAAATVPPAPAKRIADSPPHTPPAQQRIVDAEPAPRGVLGDGDPGIATGIGVLFILAVRWGPPRSPVSSARQRMTTADPSS